MNTVVILGTARNDSNTLAAVQKLSPVGEYEILDLSEFQIAPYRYNQKENLSDDFLSLAQKISAAENIIFATPVYWYSMSGSMKTFMDRLTDLTGIHKAIGKSLRGKKTYLIASGGSASLPEGFELPFKLTSEYFDMEFVQTFYQQGR